MYNDGNTKVVENGHWQGTIVYMEITTSREINPNDVVDHRTDAEEHKWIQKDLCCAERRKKREIFWLIEIYSLLLQKKHLSIYVLSTCVRSTRSINIR